MHLKEKDVKRRFFPWGCLLAVVLALVVMAIGAAVWIFRSQLTLGRSPAASPVNVFLLTPSSGDEVHAGDYVGVTLNAQAPAGIANAELFVDGTSLGTMADMPERAWWSWQAWPPGIHTLSARATSSDGQVGQSQTVIVNVLALSPLMQVSAGSGQTLAQIGAKYGVPPDQMGSANPHVDATQPLQDGQPVKVPTGGAGPGGLPPQPPVAAQAARWAAASHPISSGISRSRSLSMIPTATSQRAAACGTSCPSSHLISSTGLDNLYTQLLDSPPNPDTVLQADCWGWLGGALKYLGQGQSKFDPGHPDNPLSLNGDGFQLIGTPHFPPVSSPQAYMIKPQIEPTYGVREPKNTAECYAHKGNSLLCDATLNAALKTDIVLEWEWIPGVHWPSDPAWITQIDGYDVYEIDPATQQPTLMKQVFPSVAKVAALPLPWGARCYGVDAYADSPQYGGKVTSKMSTYCPGQAPATENQVLGPVNWITTGGDWINVGCPFELPGYAFGDKQLVMVGSYIVDNGDCFEQGEYSAGLLYPQFFLPPGAILQTATLTFEKMSMDWGATGVALEPAPQTCVAAIGTATQDWSGLGTGDHVSNLPGLAHKPFASVPPWTTAVDVTPVFSDWLQHPANNHGFVLTALNAPAPSQDGMGECLSQLGSLSLGIKWLAP